MEPKNGTQSMQFDAMRVHATRKFVEGVRVVHWIGSFTNDPDPSNLFFRFDSWRFVVSRSQVCPQRTRPKPQLCCSNGGPPHLCMHHYLRSCDVETKVLCSLLELVSQRDGQREILTNSVHCVWVIRSRMDGHCVLVDCGRTSSPGPFSWAISSHLSARLPSTRVSAKRRGPRFFEKKTIFVFPVASFESVTPFRVAFRRAWATRSCSHAFVFHCPHRRRRVAFFLPQGWLKTQCLKCPDVWLCRLLLPLRI